MEYIKPIARPRQGIALIFTLITSLVLLLTCLTLVDQLQLFTSVDGYSNNSENAALIAETGISLVVKQLSSDTDWSDNSGLLYSNNDILNGICAVSGNPLSANRVLITATGLYSGTTSTITRDLQVPADKASYFSVNTTLANIGGADDKQLLGLTIANSNPTQNVTINQMIVSWYEQTSRKVSEIVINGTTIWNTSGIGSPTVKLSSGTLIDNLDYLLSAGSIVPLTRIAFDGDMEERIIALVFILDDGSTYTADFDPLVGLIQANELTIDTSNATIDDEWLEIIYLGNASPTWDIVIEAISISWTPNIGEEFIQIKIDGSTKWNDDGISGTEADISDYTLSPLDSEEELRIKFDDDLEEKIFYFTFHMADGSEITTMADCRSQIIMAEYLTVNIISANISGPANNYLSSIALDNLNAVSSLVISEIYVAWVTANSERLDSIYINGSSKYSGSSSSGTTANITDYTLNPAITNIPLELRFDSNINTKDFTLRFGMQDLSVRIATVNFRTTVATTLGSDGFESGNWSGGSGWASGWSTSGQCNVLSSDSPYAGTYHARIRSSSATLYRTIDLAGHTSATLLYAYKASGWESSDYVQVIVNDGTDHVVATYVDGIDDDTYRTVEINLSGYNMINGFAVKFASYMDQGNDYFFVDDVSVTGN